MLEMAKIFGKWLKHFDKRLNYVGDDFEIWEMAKIFV